MKKLVLLSFFLLFGVLMSCEKTNEVIAKIELAKKEQPEFTYVKLDNAEQEAIMMPQTTPVRQEKEALSLDALKEIRLIDSLLALVEVNDDTSLDAKIERSYKASLAQVDSFSLDEWQSFLPGKFKSEQLKYTRVATLYKDYENYVKKLLVSKGMNSFDIDFFMRAFKEEGVMELWAKPKNKASYSMLISYPFFQGSSQLGPKQREGDLQVPEGFYKIDYFNPESLYKLSLRVNYPNKADLIRNANESAIGGAICIHGNKCSVGCLAMTDYNIPTIYLLALEAKDRGQLEIPIHIFPTRLSTKNMKRLASVYAKQTAYLKLWRSMQDGYEYFEETQQLPPMQITEKGLYAFVEP